MLKAKVIGIGAAGNKAAIKLIETGVMESSDVLLLNSTIRDVPQDYREYAIEFQGSTKGCAKERHLAKEMAVNTLRNEVIDLDSFIGPDDNMVIICNSSEGGTGCGASTVIAKYLSEVLEVTVHMFVFGGFEEDVRGLKNTVDYFKELSPEYIVEGISNKKFLSECNNNKPKAEQAANIDFAKKISILLGKGIYESEQNIDKTDLIKLNTTPGYMQIFYGALDKVKNVEEFNKVVSSIIDNSKTFDTEIGCENLGVILNIHDKTKNNIDYFHTVIKEKLGTPKDTLFTHVQDKHEEEYIQIIVSGMKMPITEIEEVYNELVTRVSKIDRSEDDFFTRNFDTSIGENNMKQKTISASKIKENKANFFGGVKGGTFKNITKISDDI